MIYIFSKDMSFSALLDIYGNILSERKKEILEYYYFDDYSLSEISELTGISRQGVRDSIKKGEEEIKKLENSLNIHENDIKLKNHLVSVADKLKELNNKYHDEDLLDLIKEIDSITENDN